MKETEEYENIIEVKVDKKEPSSSEIRKHMNFPVIMKAYHDIHTPKGLYKLWYYDKRKLSMIVVILIIILLIALGEIDLLSYFKK